MHTGDRVRLRRLVERFPHFIAREGLTGTIVKLDDDELGGVARVRMDMSLPGAEEWDNEIIWTDEDGPLVDDVEPLPEGRFANLDF